MVPDDKTFLQQLLQPVADRGKIITPGAPWAKAGGKMFLLNLPIPICSIGLLAEVQPTAVSHRHRGLRKLLGGGARSCMIVFIACHLTRLKI